MKPFMWALATLFGITGPQLPTLEIGDAVPADATDAHALILVSSAQMQHEWEWSYDGIVYQLGVDEQRVVQYIATHSTRVSTPEGVRVGQRWSKLSGIGGASIGERPGWGKVAEFPSGWHAASYSFPIVDDGPSDPPEEVVNWLFKGTSAGYGRRKSVPPTPGTP